MWAAIEQFIIGHQPLILAVSIASGVLFLTSLILIPFAVLRIPEDYFIRTKQQPGESGAGRIRRPPIAWRAAWLIVRNILGVLFLILGGLLLVLPGPGWLTILVGIALIEFPLKHKLEMKILSLPVVRNAVNSYRVKKNKPPILFPGPALQKKTTETRRYRGTQRGKRQKE